MSTPQHVLVYEFLSAGAIIADLSPEAHAELRAQGIAMRDAMLADLRALPGRRVRVVMAATDRTMLPGVESVHAQPAEPHAALLQRMAQEGASVWAVAPETAGALETLARAVPAAQWLGCTPQAIALAASKTATCRHLAARGIAVPDPARHPSGAWVVKPDDGAGAMDTRRHPGFTTAQTDARERFEQGINCTLEPWIDGEALSLALCCRPHDVQVLGIQRQQIEVDAQGQVHFLGVQPAAIDPAGECGARLAALAAEVARAVPGLRGFVGIDLVWHARQGPVVIEINPRLTTAYVGLSARLGFNVAPHLLIPSEGHPS